MIPIAFLVVLFVGFTAGVIFVLKSTSKKKARATQVETNHYHDLRNLALNSNAQQLGFPDSEEPKVFGVVADIPMGDVIITVATFFTGDASIYISSGAMFIGGIGHETVRNAAKDVLGLSQAMLPRANEITGFPSPSKTHMQFTLLTNQGRFCISQPAQEMENGTSPFAPMFYVVNDVITEYRLVSEK